MILPLLGAVGFALRHVLVEAMYAGGAYSTTAIDATGTTLGMFVLGLPAQVLVVPVATLFIVQKDAVFPLKIAVANVILNVTLNAVLRGPLGVAGIALSTTVTLTVLCAAMVLAAGRRWGSLGLRGALRPLALSLGASVAIAIAGTIAVRQADPISREGQVALAASLATTAVLVHLAVLTAGGGAPGTLPAARRALGIARRRLRRPTAEA
jgi:putative peptidoglycan lipid II flippase